MSGASAFAGFFCFLVALLSSHLLAAPPALFDPQSSKYLGRWLYLTYQSNMIGLCYFGASLVDSLIGGALSPWLIQCFPLMFAVGTFLTFAYYTLDHFNAENFLRKERCRSRYPYVHWCSHIEHGHALPAVVFHAAAIELPPGVEIPMASTVLGTVGVYLVFYILFVHVNCAFTGMWPYAIIDDMTRRGGAALRTIFFAALIGIFLMLGMAGVAILEMRL